MSNKPTALLIPSPWSGDENDPAGVAYAAWYRLYRTTRIVRHRLGLHDWRPVWIETGRKFRKCDWCGARRHD